VNTTFREQKHLCSGKYLQRFLKIIIWYFIIQRLYNAGLWTPYTTSYVSNYVGGWYERCKNWDEFRKN